MRRSLRVVTLLGVIVSAACAPRHDAPGPRSLAPALDAVERQDLVARRFAPVFLQNRRPERTRTDNGDAFEDHFVRVDYDGDWNGYDNSANLREAASSGKDLSAHVYYAVQETERHYYLHYAYFHPRDPKWFGFHENDVEGGMLVVRKAASWGDQLRREQLVMAQAQAHNRFSYRKAGELCMTSLEDSLQGAECGGGTDPEKTHPILVSQAGRGFPANHGHGTEIPRAKRSLKKDAFVYVPGEAPGVPALPPAGAVAYRLVSLTGDRDGDGRLDERNGVASPPGLWDRRFDRRVYGRAAAYRGLAESEPLGHALQSGNACKANLPWGWFGVESGVPHGMFFLDPARLEARATLAKQGVVEPAGASYVSNVYLNGKRVAGLCPAPNSAAIQCDCSSMKAAFDSGTASGLDALEGGPGCALVERDLAPPIAVARTPLAERWSTCRELERWVTDDDKNLVSRVGGGPDEESCALRVTGGSYLRLPAHAETVPLESVSRLPRLFDPERYAAVRVRARTELGAPYALGGFWLHRGGRYDDSMATVPFFAGASLATGEWRTVTLALDDSPHVRGDGVVFLALGPDASRRLAVTSAEPEPVEGGDVEIDSIELVPRASFAAARAARSPLRVAGFEPARARFGEPVTVRGSGFAEPCELNFVTFGDAVLKITGCTASSITVEANGVGQGAVRVRTSGGRVAEAPQRLVIEVER